MKVGFFHDARLYKGKDSNIYSVGFGYDIWQRYLKVFDEVVVCTRESENIIEDYSKYRLSSGEGVQFNLNSLYKNPIQFFIDRKRIKKTISDVISNVDCCIVRLPSVIGILAIEECIRQNKPWIVEVVACCWDSLWNYGNIQGKLFAPIMYILNKYYIRQSTHALYVSREFLQNRYPCKGLTKSISDVKIDDAGDNILKKRIEKFKSRDKNKTVIIGMVGSLNVEYKGHEIAIKSIRELKDMGYNVMLRCLGGGNKEKWIQLCERLKIKDCVEFCGILPSGEPVLQWIDNIDIFIMPSLQEGLPRAMVEAMSRGCPTIGANTGGIPELLNEDFIVQRKNSKQISKLIVKLIESEELYISQSKRNFYEAKKYDKNEIEKNRTTFLKKCKKDFEIINELGINVN